MNRFGYQFIRDMGGAFRVAKQKYKLEVDARRMTAEQAADATYDEAFEVAMAKISDPVIREQVREMVSKFDTGRIRLVPTADGNFTIETIQ